MRGIQLIQAPTTLLSMADSSIGGKVGVNHKRGKNLIGAFHQPQAVVIRREWLSTISRRDIISGMGEIIKTAFISSEDFLRKACDLIPGRISADHEALPGLIQTSLLVKGEVVRLDTHEKGIRAVLNFGHTFAHAIEKVEGYGKFRHGEAVLAGIVGALYLSNHAGYLSGNRLGLYLHNIGPFINTLKPLRNPAHDYLLAMSVDKKVRDRQSVFVLLKEAGKPIVRTMSSDKMILGAINQMKDFVNSRSNS
jgi:3-dehydroquinate synthase